MPSFDPVEAMSQLNKIGHGFSRVYKSEKGGLPANFVFCFLRGDRNVLEAVPWKALSCGTEQRLFIRQTRAPIPAPDEPQSFFIGDTPSSEDDPFGWGGDFDQDHQGIPDQDLQSYSAGPINHAGMNLDLLPGHVMEEAKSGGASMEEDEPEEDPFGRSGDLSQDHQDMLDQGLPSGPDRPNGPADADVSPIRSFC